MSLLKRNRRFGWLAASTVAAVGLVAAALPLAPAKAQVYFGFGPGGFGVGFGGPVAPYYSPYYTPYYAPPYYYSPYYWGW